MTKAIITQFHNNKILLIYEENILVECYPIQEDSQLQIGNIYIGKVETVVKNIQSAFVRLDENHIGYLPLDDKPAYILNRKLPKGLSSIAEGDKVLVQVIQEPQKMKQAKLSGNISISGKYIAMDLSSGHIGISKKMKDVEKLNEIIDCIKIKQDDYVLEQKIFEYSNDKYPFGCVLRTACQNALKESIIDEYMCLQKEMHQILQQAFYEKNISCIKCCKEQYLSLLNEYGIERIHEIKTDLHDVYDELLFLHMNVVLYSDYDYPLSKLLSLETELSKLLNKKVWLKSGGFLIIEPTEAMVVIDVNSGKSIGKKNKDNHILKINLEAAQEITRQLRLRNLSGIIMIDFINMGREDDKKQVISCIEAGLKKDKIPGYFVEITKLGVFELTRKKVRRPLHELLFFDYKNEKFEVRGEYS